MGLFIVLIIWGIWKNTNDQESIMLNKKGTVGKITKITSSSTKYTSQKIHFVYYVNGKKYKGSDALRDGYPRRVRLSKPQIGKYYVVEYDSINHKNHRIVIERQPLNPRMELNFTDKIEGCVKRESNLGNYTDLFIEYRAGNSDYEFRTRLHKDSLNIYESSDCFSGKAISLEVSKRHPFFNNLYFKSRDRQYKGAYSTEGKWNQ